MGEVVRRVGAGRKPLLASVLAVPLSLVALHLLLPEPLTQSLRYGAGEFEVWTLWTSAYVHWGWPHLLGNLVGYATALFPLWQLLDYRGLTRRLRAVVGSALVCIPVPVTLVNAVGYRVALQHVTTITTCGFSGVVSGLFGALFACFVGFVAERRTRLLGVSFGLGILIVVCGAVLVAAGVDTVWLYALAVAGLAVGLCMFVSESRSTTRAERHVFGFRRVGAFLLVYGTLDFALVAPGFLPLSWAVGPGTVGIFGHVTGFFVGTVLYAAVSLFDGW